MHVPREKTENAVADSIVESLQLIVPGRDLPTLSAEARRKIFIGTTCGHTEGDLRLILQSAQQDIVIYLKDQNIPLHLGDEKVFTKFSKSFTDDELIIPIVVFEVKLGSVVTHAVRQYSEIARLIKSIFPFCRYDLLLLDMQLSESTDKIYMAGKDFDRIIYRPDHSTDQTGTIEEMVKEIKEHVLYLKNNPFYRMNRYL